MLSTGTIQNQRMVEARWVPLAHICRSLIIICTMHDAESNDCFCSLKDFGAFENRELDSIFIQSNNIEERDHTWVWWRRAPLSLVSHCSRSSILWLYCISDRCLIYSRRTFFFFSFIQINLNAQNDAHPLAGDSFPTQQEGTNEKTEFSRGSDEENGR